MTTEPKNSTAQQSEATHVGGGGLGAMFERIMKLSGRDEVFHAEKPDVGVCEVCSGDVEPVEMFHRWSVPTICGEIWQGPRTGDPVGCQGKADYADHLNRIKQEKMDQASTKLTRAGLTILEVAEAQRGRLLPALQGLTLPDNDPFASLMGASGAYIEGDYGTGKTTQLVLAVMHYIQEGWKARYTTQDAMISSLLSTADPQRSVEHWATFDLLVIDEFGFSLESEWERKKLYEILDARYRTKKPTMIASIYSLDDMHRDEDLSVRIGRRIARRLEDIAGLLCDVPRLVKLEGDPRREAYLARLEGRA